MRAAAGAESAPVRHSASNNGINLFAAVCIAPPYTSKLYRFNRPFHNRFFSGTDAVRRARLLRMQRTAFRPR
jgi:hypothetical protein